MRSLKVSLFLLPLFYSVLILPVCSGEPLSRSEILSGIDKRIEEHRKGEVELSVELELGVTIPEGTQVLVEQTAHQFLFGSNIFLLGRSDSPENEEAYREQFAEIFNFATLPFYWWSYEPRRGQTNEERIEQMLEWCESRRIRTKGHTLAWNFIDPVWLEDDVKVAQNLQMDRISQIVGQFAGRIDTWDVINEATQYSREETSNRAPILTKLIDSIGVKEYLRLAFGKARKANTNATLLINDYRVDDDYSTLVLEEMKETDGSPQFDAIGIQSHQHRDSWSVEKIWEVCERFRRYNKPLHFTEVTFLSGTPGWYMKREDPSFFWGSTPEGELRQAREVELFYRILFSHPAVEAITWWDFSDQRAWQGAPAGLLREDMSPKPAYEALRKLIRRDWWTKATYVTDSAGRVIVRGFKGSYRITVQKEEDILEGTFKIRSGNPSRVRVVLR